MRRSASRTEAFDGSDPADLEGLIERLVAFNRRRPRPTPGIYRDLAVRTQDRGGGHALASIARGAAHAELIRCDRGRARAASEPTSSCSRPTTPRDGGPAAERVRRSSRPTRQRVDGPLHGVPVAVKDNIDVRGS